jgi:hypothetical protein
MGVSDGVGGWATIGGISHLNLVDSSLFSWTLMENSQEYVKKNPNIFLSPLSIMEYGYNKIITNKEVKAGR